MNIIFGHKLKAGDNNFLTRKKTHWSTRISGKKNGFYNVISKVTKMPVKKKLSNDQENYVKLEMFKTRVQQSEKTGQSIQQTQGQNISTQQFSKCTRNVTRI